tara:strand:+ start:1228 stop:1506 length:279 start_codon:yes stop_codon:yes gene_type:complete
MSSFLHKLLESGEITSSNEWDATYKSLPVVIAEDLEGLALALERLEAVGGYGYVATWERNLFLFNPKMLSKRCGLINENAKLLKVARVPKNR